MSHKELSGDAGIVLSGAAEAQVQSSVMRFALIGEQTLSTQIALTESVWMRRNWQISILDALMGYGAGNRELRLFAVAYFRKHYESCGVRVSRIQAAVEAAEHYADGKIDSARLAEARAAVEAIIQEMDSRETRLARAALLVAASAPSSYSFPRSGARVSSSGRRTGKRFGAFDIVAVVEALGTSETNELDVHEVTNYDVFESFEEGEPIETEWLNQLRHDIFGNPFRPVRIDSAWFTPKVIAIAESIYEERTFDVMGILADALEDSGCDEERLLAHCRQSGEHVRGCWVLDLILGNRSSLVFGRLRQEIEEIT